MGNFGKVKEDLFGKKVWIFEIPRECKILLSLGKNLRFSFALRRTSIKSLANTELDSYSSHSQDIVGEVYDAFMIFYPFSTKKLDISVISFRMQSTNRIHFNVQQKVNQRHSARTKSVSGKFAIKIKGQQTEEKSSIVCTHLTYY